MPIVRIQHAVPNFENWKRAFDSDPMDRKGSGVRSYRIFRSIEDQDLVMIDLEMSTIAEANTMLVRLHELWRGPGGAVMREPQARIVENVESISLG